MDPLNHLSLPLGAGGGAGPLLTTVVTAIVAGVGLLILARRMGFPAIVLLLGGGVLLGPMVWGASAPIQPASLGDGLGVVVSLAVGLILFEGGLTLDREGYSSAPTVIRRLLTLGVGVTWFGTAVSLRYLCDVKWDAAVTTASLVIVTGPTVVGPLLKRLGVAQRLANILRWEAVLIDPIGVFIAVLSYEWLIQGEAQNAFLSLAFRAVGGIVVGLLGGGAIALGMRKRRWVPDDLLNIFVLAGAVLTFGAAEAIRPEAGLLSVTVAGFVVGLTKGEKIERVHKFKEELTNLLIALVFMLLAARLNMEQVKSFGWQGAMAVLSVILLVRPLSIALCTLGQPLGFRERLFLSWIAPRGVVAASMASLIAIHLEARGATDTARMVETFTWSVIVGTIVFQGLSAGSVVRALGLQQPRPTGWAIVGAHALSRALARALSPEGTPEVILVDNNAHHVADANNEGLRAIVADARDLGLASSVEFSCVGNLIALTDNEDLNLRICTNWAPHLGAARVFRWAEHEGPDLHSKSGQPLVWGDEPSAIAFDVHRGSRILTRLGPSQAEGRTLLTVDAKGQVGPEASIRLALLPRGAALDEGFDAARVWESDAEDMDALTLEIRTRLATFLDADTRVHPAVVEDGVAVAHAHSPLVEKPQLSAVRLKAPGLILAPDPEPPVRVVFVLVSPQGNSRAHLAAIGELARLLADDVSRHAFVDAGADLGNVVRASLDKNASEN